MKNKFGILFAIVAIGFMASTTLATYTQRQKITSTPRGVGAQFGNAVAVSGNTMVVGAQFDSTTASQAGAAFVFTFDGAIWTQQAKLVAGDGALGDKFGTSVAISGDTIVVGAFNANAPLSNGGAAYVFVRSGTIWTQQQKLTANDGTADDQFGNSAAIFGNVIVIGANHADSPGNSESGAAYRFERVGTVWSHVQRLSPVAQVILGDHFGDSMAISGNKLAIGASGDDTPQTSAGAVYVFADTGSSYVLEQKLTIPDGRNGDDFGNSVDIEGDTLVGGALQYTPIVGQPAYGAAYVFEFNGSTWSSQGRLTASDGASVDRFGYSVAVRNNVIAVGAREDDTAVGPDAGSAYIFDRIGAAWTQRQKLEPSDSFNGDRFGVSVALSFGNLIVGAAEKALTSPNGQGAAYFYSLLPVCDSMTFAPARLFTVGNQPRSLDAGDFNRDGKPDLVAANTNGRTLSVLIGNGAGSFATLVDYPLGNGNPYSLAVSDLNRDGKEDLVAGNNNGTFSVLLGIGDGTFGAATAVNNTAGFAGSLAIADLNLDGKPDLASLSDIFANDVAILLGNGDGTFGAASRYPVQIAPESISVDDFNRDGKPDLAVSNNNSDTVSVLLGDGLGGFAPAVNFATAHTPRSVATGDFNGDGNADIAAANINANNVSILIGNGAGGFASPINVPVSIRPSGIVTNDLNLDGKDDLVISSLDTNAVTVLLGNGMNGFVQGPVKSTFGDFTTSPVVADFNLDGLPDVATSNAGSSNISVLLSTCGQPLQNSTLFDYDGDGKSDVSVFRPSSGTWYLQRSQLGFTAINWGLSTDKITPADFDGDGKTDVAVFRPSTGTWYIFNSATSTFISQAWGVSGDLPTPADYDGDGKADITVFRPSAGTWYRLNSTNGSFITTQFGTNGDKPVTGDYDGDGKADVAVFRQSAGTWYVLRSSDQSFYAIQWGISTDASVPADYDGDGKADVAVFRPSTGTWYVLKSSNSSVFNIAWGLSTDLPASADFDGDGKADVTVFRPSTGTWYVLNSSNGTFNATQFGLSGDIPTENAFRY